MKILSFGEIIWDVYPHKKCIGGAPLNFAAHASRAGAESYLLSSVGDDELGREAIDILNHLCVNIDLVSVNSEKSTGTCTVLLDKNGIPTYKIENDTSYDYVHFDKKISLHGFDAVSFGTLALRYENNRYVLKEILKGYNGVVLCDLNLRSPFYNAETVRWAISVCQVLKINEDELNYISESIVKAKLSDVTKSLDLITKEFKNLELIIYTCGEKGAYVYEKSTEKTYFCPAKKVKVLSTVGAGDSFGAVFLTEYLSGKSIDACLEKATEVSGKVVACEDAVPVDL